VSKIILHADDFGRSLNISKSIYKCILAKKISSISIIVSEKIYGLNLLKKIKVNKRFHLNLTDFSKKKSNKNFIYNSSFLSLMIMPLLPDYINKRKFIEREIIRQLEQYKNKIQSKDIFIDGHQHVHMIPWIFDIIFNIRKKYNITKVRIPNEKFIIVNKDFFNLQIIKNIFKFILIKFLILISNKKISKINYNYSFFGLIYSGHQNKEYLKKILDYQKKNLKKKIEILLHPGFATKKEKNLFKKNFFDYYYY
jgi:chitin disaccharide deacetylase